ncbi:cell filamentation protein Fic [Flavobacterium sp. NST-5]|uniref:Cell filamentation protein Fic n=1 Tax=Flavobacterium ichthyis TaxID=2698827 RepID=A0ABW9Z9G7_9FLAO|nr:Fic family protein [Flavobacterium ichthyis]NBL65212.1 cell filamentation protein Fic [Flavobacterium ichthyis]
MNNLQIISPAYFEAFKKSISKDFAVQFEAIKSQPNDTEAIKKFNIEAVVASSKIEGEKVQLEEYHAYKIYKKELSLEIAKRPDDLFEAYQFAQQEKLSFDNFFKAHAMISKNLLPSEQQGRLRFGQKVISGTKNGKISYEACQASDVPTEFRKLFDDIVVLLKQKLSLEEIFYYAAYIHLVYVKIHPFEDGNGRSARLLEKWFLDHKLDIAVWGIPSEKYYYDYLPEYYKSLEDVGFFYEKLDYAKAIPFLTMLVKSVSYQK